MKRLMTEVQSESDIHSLLQELGFTTNYNKKLNENGVDIVALKDGDSYLIEHKMVALNKTTGAYKIEGGVVGDILMVTTPKGRSFFVVNGDTSLAKTCRFLDNL